MRLSENLQILAPHPGAGISVNPRRSGILLRAFLLDWLLVFYTLILAAFLAGRLFASPVTFLVPVPVLALVSLELAVAWSCLGRSPGAVLSGFRIVSFSAAAAAGAGEPPSGTGSSYLDPADLAGAVPDAPPLRARLVRFVAWHLAALPFFLGHLLLKDNRGLHEKISSTKILPDEYSGPPVPWYCEGWKVFLLFTFLLTVAVGWVITGVQFLAVFTGFGSAHRIVSGLLNPNFSIIEPMLQAIVETVFLAFMATLFALPFAFILSFPGARNIMPRTPAGTFVYVVVRTFFNIIRSVEPVAWAIIFAVWVGIGPFAGVLALWIHSVAALGKLYSEQVESIDQGPVEAVTACGAGRLQTIRYAVIPQVVPPFVAFTIYRWDINVRMATIVGFVGGGGIGQALIQYQQLLRWREVGLILWLITIVVWILDFASARLREKII